jgi:D-alanyl-lipoteichoic acid acyltransferase DltB (MBOAT superfamily)
VLRDKQTGRLPEFSLPEFATYVVFFPTLAAGPIDRAERFTQDLQKDFALTQEGTLLAGQRLVPGLFKKFVIADTLALIALNDALAAQVRTAGWMWIVVYAYAFQIYFDFSGYTDIAIGIARLVGIRLPENFAAPYTKPNLTQFWNSWHMTLTQWFRSYFFNPFNRWMRGYKSIPAWGMILTGQAATMLLIGLWHGITPNFVLWGLWHGLGLFLHNRWSDLVRTRFPGWVQDPRLQRVLQIGGILLTFHFVALGWVFFALSDLSLSWQVFLALSGVSR